MIRKTYDTIIIGGGIAGLSCAYHLQQQGQDFLLISKDIGGRIRTSADGTVNYGAFFVCSDYDTLLPFVTLRHRIHLSDFCFHENDTMYPFYEPRLLLYLSQLMKTKRLLYRFRNHLRRLRKATETISQKNALEADSFLHDLYLKNAADFIKEHDLTRGTHRYLSKALYSTTFSGVQEMNAFSFLHYLLPLITPIFTFTFEKKTMTASFQEKIRIDSVIDIHSTSEWHKIKTTTETFMAKNLVLATELGWSSRFLGITEMNTPVSTHMMHIQGTPTTLVSRKKYHLFSPLDRTQSIADLQDGTYLLYYKDSPPALDTFFHHPELLASHFWDPAGRVNGHVLIESKRADNLYPIISWDSKRPL
ncbi:MAG: FAD-dependent oxidoreductase [Candidatus Thermoplasmatota archaeon]